MNIKSSIFVLSMSLLVACADKGDDTAGGDDTSDTDTDTSAATGIEIAGSWLDNYGSDHTVSDTEWSSYGGASVVHLSQYDNAQDFTVGQNDAANEYNPELFSRFDWYTDDAGQLWFCTTAYAAASEEEALNTAAADHTDPATTGCGGFPWSSLTPA